MTFEQEIATIDELARSCRSREQANVMLETEVQTLRADNIRLNTALEHRQEHLDALDEKTLKTTAKLEDEIRNNGELKATLKQLLAEQMALASRAAEMLRELEEKPEPALQPPGPITNANGKVEVLETSPQSPFRGSVPPFVKEMLAPFIKRDEDDLKIVPIGHYFTLDPPKVEDATERGVKWWYKLSAGKCPQFYLRDRPGVEFRMEAGGPRFVRFVTATNKEEREPLPFRPENAKPEGPEGSTQAFGDDGGSIPNFLKQGPSYADQRREADHL